VAIDVLILDVNLPGISGLELLGLLCRTAEWYEPPVILMSAAADEEEIAAASESKLVTRFIRKPFDVDQLIEFVRVAVADHLAKH